MPLKRYIEVEYYLLIFSTDYDGVPSKREAPLASPRCLLPREIYTQRQDAEDSQICPHIDTGFPRVPYSIIPPPCCRSKSLAAQGFQQPEMRTSNPLF